MSLLSDPRWPQPVPDDADLPDLDKTVFLNTAQALRYLARHGVITSRSGLDRARAEGRLKHFDARGRVRLLYRREDLIAAFIQGGQPCRLASSNGAKSGTSGDRSRAESFAAALALATEKRR